MAIMPQKSAMGVSGAQFAGHANVPLQIVNQAAMQQTNAKYPMDHAARLRHQEECDLLLTNPGLISLKQEMKKVIMQHEQELLELRHQYEMMLALLRKPLEDL